jgi:hypothetical protein
LYVSLRRKRTRACFQTPWEVIEIPFFSLRWALTYFLHGSGAFDPLIGPYKNHFQVLVFNDDAGRASEGAGCDPLFHNFAVFFKPVRVHENPLSTVHDFAFSDFVCGTADSHGAGSQHLLGFLVDDLTQTRTGFEISNTMHWFKGWIPAHRPPELCVHDGQVLEIPQSADHTEPFSSAGSLSKIEPK